MSNRVEKAALDAWVRYEYREHPKGLYHTCFMDGYKDGYAQAEQDLALTEEDIKRLDVFLTAIRKNKTGAFTFTRMTSEQYHEVLKHFNECKK